MAGKGILILRELTFRTSHHHMMSLSSWLQHGKNSDSYQLKVSGFLLSYKNMCWVESKKFLSTKILSLIFGIQKKLIKK